MKVDAQLALKNSPRKSNLTLSENCNGFAPSCLLNNLTKQKARDLLKQDRELPKLFDFTPKDLYSFGKHQLLTGTATWTTARTATLPAGPSTSTALPSSAPSLASATLTTASLPHQFSNI